MNLPHSPGDDLGEALSATLAGWLEQGMVTGSLLLVEFIDVDGEPRWTWTSAPGQTMTHTLGLIEWARGLARYEQQRYLDELEGE